MLAALITTPGRPPVMADRERPSARAGHVLIEVTAAPITPLDILCASGTSYFGVPSTPYVPGVQGVGTADGSPVWFATTAGMAAGDGSMAETVCVPAEDVVPLPEDVSAVAIAALGLSAVAAYMALTLRGGLAAGQRVIVLGAGGVVGQAAVQLARLAGADRVVAGARSPAAQARALEAGADAVVALDTDDVPALAARFAESAQGPVDLVLDPLFGAPAAAAARTLRPGGRLVNLGSSAAQTCPIDSATLRSGSLQILGYTNNELPPSQRALALRTIASHAAAGRLRVAHETVPLAESSRAWTRQAEGQAAGRIVLVP